ncbi:MAG: hypothetical protein E5V99_03385, partial [Mesorhizobium sp.]
MLRSGIGLFASSWPSAPGGLPGVKTLQTRTLGFVGLGRMGAPMVRRLAEAGHHVIVHDRRPDAATD